MATRLTDVRPLSRENITIDERNKVHITPCIRPSAGQVFGVESEREERDSPTPDRTNDFSAVCLMLSFAFGFTAATILAAVGWAVSLR